MPDNEAHHLKIISFSLFLNILKLFYL